MRHMFILRATPDPHGLVRLEQLSYAALRRTLQPCRLSARGQCRERDGREEKQAPAHDNCPAAIARTNDLVFRLASYRCCNTPEASMNVRLAVDVLRQAQREALRMTLGCGTQLIRRPVMHSDT